jgi:hypothetical protein
MTTKKTRQAGSPAATQAPAVKPSKPKRPAVRPARKSDGPAPGTLSARQQGCLCARVTHTDQRHVAVSSCPMHGRDSGREHVNWND